MMLSDSGLLFWATLYMQPLIHNRKHKTV